MALVNTPEFWIIGVIMGAILVIGIIYCYKLISGRSWFGTSYVVTEGGRRKRPRQIKKRR